MKRVPEKKKKTLRDFPGYVVNAYNAVVNASNAEGTGLIPG